MPLEADAAVEQLKRLKSYRENEGESLDVVRRYWKGRQALPAVIPSASPREVRTMARIARVNVLSIVIDTLAQSTFVDGFRGKDDDSDAEVWSIWQANKLDARQTGIHRAAFAYGASYALVLPGDPVPVIRGASPRALTALYGEDPDWPMWALEKADDKLWRLFDSEAIYYIGEERDGHYTFIETREHGAGVTPVIRYLDEDDLDADDDVDPAGDRQSGLQHDQPMRGQVAPLMSIQDQIDLHTFSLLVKEWYGGFRQRYAIGWVAPEERDLIDRILQTADEPDSPTAEEQADAAAAAARIARMKSGASQLWTFDEHPDDMKLGEFEQSDLKGGLEAREQAIRFAATLSQTPVHELIGQMVNLSAEALAAAEAGRDRKVDERKTLLGESHEQTLWLAGRLGATEIPEDAQVVWRDTSARAFSATVDALGKLVTMLGIPPQELWERVPGATRQDVARWKAAAEQGDSFAVLADLLNRQANGNGAEPAPAFAG